MPHLLPGGRALLYTAVVSDGDEIQTRIVVDRLDGQEPATVIEDAADARYVPTGHLLYMRRGTLMAVRFDVDRLERIGAPVALLDDVMQAIGAYNTGAETRIGQFVVSADGTLVYLPGGVYPPRLTELVWVDRDGAATVVHGVARTHLLPRVSPDGRRIAYLTTGVDNSDIWVSDLEGTRPSRLTSGGDNVVPVWSPDSRFVAFRRRVPDGFEIARIAATGTGSPERLAAIRGYPASWSQTGILALLTNNRIQTMRANGNGDPEPWLESRYVQLYPEFSPDGAWIAYVSPETDREEVWVAPYPGSGDRTRVTTRGGHSPVWSRTGGELFYMRLGDDVQQLWSIEVDTRDGFRLGEERMLFEGPYLRTRPVRNYDVAPDGRFIMTWLAGDPEPPFTHLHIWLNWAEELTRVLPAR